MSEVTEIYWVYAISSTHRKYIYVGMTNDLNRRLEQHNTGKNPTTKPYLPFKVLLTEKFSSRAEAREREKKLKTGCGKEFLKTLL